MPAGLLLKSEGCASNLSDPEGRFTLEQFCRDNGLAYGDHVTPVPLDAFARTCLLEGVDTLGYLLRQHAAIAAYESRLPVHEETAYAC